MEETADSMARRRDVAGKAMLDAAIASASGHSTTSSGSVLTKTAVDAIIKAAAQIGFPVTQMALNPGRIVDMTAWTFGTTSAIPWSFAPEDARQQIFRQLYAEGYGGLRYIFSHNIAMTTVYLSGDPPDTGYHQDHGQAQAMSDVNIRDGVDEHVIREDDAYYVGNVNNVWSITI